MDQRKHPRLKGYDYSQGGAYFVTFCTRNRKCILSRISVGRADSACYTIDGYWKIGERIPFGF